MPSGRTAILYFAYRPEVEAQRKPLFPSHGHQFNAQIYHELQDELFERVTPLGLPLIHIDERQQQGEGFAERISHAVEQVWEQGYERVIILGNDCPELRADDYQHCIELLDQGSSCLVRTQHGGAGLIALHRHQYHGQHWRELEWQSQRTFDELFDCLADCRVLDRTLIELNGLSDAHEYIELHRVSDDPIAHMLDSLLNPLRSYISLQSIGQEQSTSSTRKLRGPPFLA